MFYYLIFILYMKFDIFMLENKIIYFYYKGSDKSINIIMVYLFKVVLFLL